MLLELIYSTYRYVVPTNQVTFESSNERRTKFSLFYEKDKIQSYGDKPYRTMCKNKKSLKSLPQDQTQDTTPTRTIFVSKSLYTLYCRQQTNHKTIDVFCTFCINLMRSIVLAVHVLKVQALIIEVMTCNLPPAETWKFTILRPE